MEAKSDQGYTGLLVDSEADSFDEQSPSSTTTRWTPASTFWGALVVLMLILVVAVGMNNIKFCALNFVGFILRDRTGV